MSPSKLRRDLARARSHALLLHSNRRRQEWLQWRSQQYQEVPADRIWLLYQICRESKSCFLDQLRSPPALPGRRRRDVFPRAPVGSEGMPYTWRRQRWQLFLTFVNAVLDVLHWLYCRKQRAPCPSQHTAAQKIAVANLVGRCLDFLERLQKPQHGEWEHLLPDWVPEIPRAAGPQYADLVAERVDNLETAASVDPLERLPLETQATLSNPSTLFPQPPPGLEHFEDFNCW